MYPTTTEACVCGYANAYICMHYCPIYAAAAVVCATSLLLINDTYHDKGIIDLLRKQWYRCHRQTTNRIHKELASIYMDHHVFVLWSAVRKEWQGCTHLAILRNAQSNRQAVNNTMYICEAR